VIQNTHPTGYSQTKLDEGFSILDLIIILLRQKKKLAIHFLAVTAFAVALSYVLPKKYKSTTMFLPPSGETMMFPAIANLGLSMNFNNESEFTPQQIESMLDSRLILEEIIRKYDLMTVYKTKSYENGLELALKRLRKNIDLKSVTESGLTQTSVIHFALSVIDKDKVRSADIANDMVMLLNQAMENLSHSQEDYTVGFIRSRLDSVVSQRLDLQKTLAQFQKTNKIYSPDMKEQVLGTVNTIAELKKQKMLGEIERDLLLMDREKDNVEVRFAQRKVSEIESKIHDLETNQKADVLPGLDYSVDIAYKYLGMVKELETLTKLELLLRQQFEEAKIKDARRAPIVRVIDKAVPPQWKNSPKKVFVVLIIVGLYMIGCMILILAKSGLARSGESARRKIEEFKAALKF